jgi:hypothetical protein
LQKRTIVILFSHCGFFDHPDLQSLNDYKFVFLVYQLINASGILGLSIYRWKGLENTLSKIILHAPKISNLQSQKIKIKI